jgi:hypothetical protein
MSILERKPALLGPEPPDPWAPIDFAKPEFGYASYYLSDELAALPIRAVTRVLDNKSDPNIETGTYGLFSTCEEKMRSGIATSRPRYIVFVTKLRGRGRHVTGLYRIAHIAPGALSRQIRDFAIAADQVRFIDPVPLVALTEAVRAPLATKWRLYRKLTPEQTAAAVAFIMDQADRTQEYLGELGRVEAINTFHSGFAYPTWGRPDGFSWADAPRYLAPAVSTGDKISNSSPTGWWECRRCGIRTENKALLKACPRCHALGELRPLSQQQLSQEE